MSKTMNDLDLPPRSMLTNKISNLNSEKSSSSDKSKSPKEGSRANSISGINELKALNLVDDTKDDLTMNRSQTIVTLMNTTPDKSQFEGGESESEEQKPREKKVPLRNKRKLNKSVTEIQLPSF